MRASTAKHPTSCRRRGTASIAILTALFVLAGGVQALAPAPAAAVDDSGPGPKCASMGIPEMPQLGWNGEELCEVTNGSGGDGGQGSTGGDPPTVTNTEPVVEIHDPVVPDDTRPRCPAFGCLRPRPPRGGGDRDLFGQVPPQERGGGSRGRDLEPARESRPEMCSKLKTTLPDARKKLGALRQELRSQQDALRLMRRWAEMAPGNSLWGPTDFNPRGAEPLVSAGLAKARQDEARMAEVLAGLARQAKKYECPLDVM
jgi:hypothetical protein